MYGGKKERFYGNLANRNYVRYNHDEKNDDLMFPILKKRK